MPQPSPVFKSWALVVTLVAIGISFVLSPTRSGAATYQIPASIPADCSVDVTQSILNYVASVPDQAVISFPAGGCYRIEGTLEFDGRSGLDFEGNGDTFRSLNPPTDQRAMWRFVDSTSISLHNLTIRGSYAQGGTHNASIEHAHGVDVRGSSVDLSGLTITDVAGDCVYFGRGYTAALTRSSGSLQNSTCLRTGRNGVAVAAGDHIRVQGITTGTIGYDAFDVEPNVGTGWGSNDVTFTGNTIGTSALNGYSIVESSTISNQSFTNNTFAPGVGARIAVSDPVGAGYRAQSVTISGNTSTTSVPPAAVNVDNVDGLTVTGNSFPISGGPMAAVTKSCNVSVSGNSYPGGTKDAAIYPWLCQVSPSSGPPGTTVAVAGYGLTGATNATLNGVKVPITSVSSTEVDFTVPTGATSGAVTVTTPSGVLTSATPFTVTTGTATTTTTTTTPPPPAASLKITGFSPTSGPVGTVVTVSGSGFSGATKCTLNGASVSFSVASDSNLMLIVPSNAGSGRIVVTAPSGTAKTSKNFSVTRTKQKSVAVVR